MNISIPPVDLSFSDFILLAILQALMYGLTGLELAVALPKKDSGTQRSDRRKAAGWAFAGILVTILAGVFAAAGIGPGEPFLVGIPLFFIARWAYYHGTSASLANVQAVREALEDHYRDAVLTILSSTPQTSDEVFRSATVEIRSFKIIERASVVARGIVPVPAKALVEELLFTPQKVRFILDRLVTDGLATKHNNDLYTKQS